jgi:two-component system, sensor histidine kinase and response regulator
MNPVSQNTRPGILYVDDETHNLNIFTNAFFREYQIYTAASVQEALAILGKHTLSVIISDQRMPDMDGLQFLSIVKNRFPAPVRIIASGYSDIKVVMDAVNEAGIFHYVLKPWNNQELKLVIDNAIEKYILLQEKEQLITELRLANQLLEKRIRERTAALEEKNKQYEQLIETKNKLFSIIAHDLRGPLGSITSFTRLMAENNLNLNDRENQLVVSKMHQNMRQTKEMLDNLLYWSLEQLGGVELSVGSYNLNEQILQNIRLLEPIAEQKHISLEYKLPPTDLLALCDKDMLDVVLRNLLSNAIKFTSHQGNIIISAHQEARQAIISVKDSGMGIPSGKVTSLLQDDHFQTTRGTQGEKGTGLGLHLCRDFIERQGGKMSITSQEGKGSTFTFSLPLSS